jgi:hypothetical protein
MQIRKLREKIRLNYPRVIESRLDRANYNSYHSEHVKHLVAAEILTVSTAECETGIYAMNDAV